MRLKGFQLIAMVLWVSIAAHGQRNRDYDNVVVKQTRIDARDLGYPPIDIIPNGESGITPLAVALRKKRVRHCSS